MKVKLIVSVGGIVRQLVLFHGFIKIVEHFPLQNSMWCDLWEKDTMRDQPD